MYKIVAYQDSIASEDEETKKEFELIKELSQDFTIENETALELDNILTNRLEAKQDITTTKKGRKSKKQPAVLDIPEIELRYIRHSNIKSPGKINSSQTAASLFREILGAELIPIQEFLIVVYLNRANEPIGLYKHSKGGISGTVIDIRLILLVAVKCLASGIMIAHNHPSGNTQPSEQDLSITRQLKAAATHLSFTVLDHVIVTNDSYYSFSDEGLVGLDGPSLSGTLTIDGDESKDQIDNDKLNELRSKASDLDF